MANTLNLPLPPQTTDVSAVVDYLYGLSQQLNMALLQLDGVEGSAVSTAQKTAEAATMRVDTAADELRSLIIKSADTVTAYADQRVDALSSVYVAQSEYGTYKDTVNRQLVQTAERTDDLYTRTESISGDVTELKRIEGYITQGFITVDGVRQLGIAISQDVELNAGGDIVTTDKSMVVITSKKMSFFINGSEKAYFSNEKLVVKDIAVDSNITFYGTWEMSSANGLTLRWIGGDGA